MLWNGLWLLQTTLMWSWWKWKLLVKCVGCLLRSWWNVIYHDIPWLKKLLGTNAYFSAMVFSGSKQSTRANKGIILRWPAEGMACYTVCCSLEDYTRQQKTKQITNCFIILVKLLWYLTNVCVVSNGDWTIQVSILCWELPK